MPAPFKKTDIQGNILKPHGRAYARLIFFRFKEAEPSHIRKAMALLGKEVTSAAKQSRDARGYKDGKKIDADFVGLYFSSAGFRSMGLADMMPCPDDEYFLKGMADQRIAERSGDYFNQIPQREIHKADAFLLIANKFADKLDQKAGYIKERFLANIATDIAELDTKNLRDAQNNSIEHFGYLDGVSTPRDEKESGKMGLIKEKTGEGYGSFVAFRKIEQHTGHFQIMVEELKAELGEKHGYDEQYCKALLMGRFPNGTPLALSDKEKPGEEWANKAFDYKGDQDGSKCPLNAHIRVVNPREKDAEGNIISTPQIIRRGMAYEAEKDGKMVKGLCFLSYQSSIERNLSPLFQRMRGDMGGQKDAIAYRPHIAEDEQDRATFYKKYGDISEGSFTQLIGGNHLTTFRGGQYFYAPSIPFLRDLEKLGAPE